jgi:transcriptional regulator with XRE-family HTH domain
MDFGSRLSGLMTERGLGVRSLARHVPCDPALISRLASGRQQPSAQIARRLDEVLKAGGELAGLAELAGSTAVPGGFAAELGAIEAARRAGVTDVGAAAVERLERVVDILATAYPTTAPAELLDRTCSYLSYVTGLLDRRTTLAEHRRLLVTAGWLSLLAATSLTDLLRYEAAAAYLATAAQMADEADHPELRAWCLETRAWIAVTGEDYGQAVALARGAQAAAPATSSAMIQSVAQEGRSLARLGSAHDTRRALCRLEALVSPLPEPDEPEHHFRYDPAKAEWYVAATLAWAGDPGAEAIAREALKTMEQPARGHPRPRRAASARLDLALALAGSGKPDEAAEVTLEAVASPYLAPSNFWRADEVIAVVSEADRAAAAKLREAISERRAISSAREGDAPLPARNAATGR